MSDESVGGLDVTEDTFFMVETENGKQIFDQREDAVSGLVEEVGVGNFRENEDSFEITAVETGDEWEVRAVSWRSIALEVMSQVSDDE